MSLADGRAEDRSTTVVPRATAWMARHPRWVPASPGVLAIGLVVAVAGIAALTPLVVDLRLRWFPLIAYLLVVVAATLIARLVGGVVAVLLAEIVLTLHVLPRLEVGASQPGPGVAGLVSFLLVSGVVVWTITSREAARRQAMQLAAENARLYGLERSARDEAERARDRLQLVSRVSELLAYSLEDPDTFARLAQLVVERVGDLCLIDVLRDGRIERVAAVHRDPAKQPLAQALMRYPPSLEGSHPVARVSGGGASEFSPTMPSDFLRRTTQDDEHYRIVRGLGFESFICVPLPAGGLILGTLTLVSGNPLRRFDREDLATVQEIGRRAGVFIDNVRAYRQRDHVARTLQEVLLPARLPEVAGFELAAGYWPAGSGLDVGGDFYDAFRRPDGSLGLVIGDVCGRGAEAAAVMGIARQAVRVAGMTERRPSTILRVANASLLQDDFGGRFVTACDVRLRVQEGGAEATVCCAGHPHPILVRSSGTAEPVGRPGDLLGVYPDVTLSDVPARMAFGDTMILFTDGLLEWPDTRDAGELFVDLLLQIRDAPVRTVVGEIGTWWRAAVSLGARDDAAVLVVRATPMLPA